MSSPITLLNAEDFLCQAKYTPADDKKKSGCTKPKSLQISRKVSNKYGGKELKYDIIENAQRLSAEDWTRVVAVVAQVS
jgi:hypothetical protein